MAFKYLYLVINVRGFKTVVRHLPHEVADLEPTLKFLEVQDLNDTETWETRYCLLIWLSIIVLLPFHMSRLDSGVQTKTVMTRLVDVTKKYLMSRDACRTAAAYLSARLLTRSDVKETHLDLFLNWIATKINDDIEEGKSWERFGPLASMAAILKHGKREDLLPCAPKLLNCILEAKCREGEYPLSSKYAMKIVGRIGLLFLKPRVASWRYNRGSRSLAANLGQETLKLRTEETEESEEEQSTPPEQVELVIEELIEGLKNQNCITRWSAAKGLGRVVGRLSKQFADQVVVFLLDLLDHRYSDGAWHGGCLALAELAKRGLLLPVRLPDVVPLITKALTYDEPKGFTSVGTNVRDAACYVCWAIARAYHPSVIEPYALQLSKTLLLVACFDREINCRRAAAAAFQENVGRLGNFPHGIDILTAADYFTVGSRSNAYLNVADFVAQFEEYTEAMMDYLLERKVDTWDPAVRVLTAKALSKLTPRAPHHMATHGLQTLISQTLSIDLNARHGSILALGEVLLALSVIKDIDINPSCIEHVENLVHMLQEKHMLRGVTGELTLLACCNFIDNCSQAKLPFHDKRVIIEWQELLDEAFSHESLDMRLAAGSALKNLCKQYYEKHSETMQQRRNEIVQKYKDKLLSTNNKTVRIGCCHAIGAVPAFMLDDYIPVVRALMQCLVITQETEKWADARTEALKAITSICIKVSKDKKTLGTCADNFSELFLEVYNAFMESLKDYTTDSRGDVGAWVREAAVQGIQSLLELLVDNCKELLTPELVSQAFAAVAQQAVEKIDRTRGHAGKVFYTLLHKSDTPIPNIPEVSKLKEIFPPDKCENVNWMVAQDTFPMFTQLVTIPQFTTSVMLGLISSVGGLTESLVKYSSQALFNHLRQQSLEELTRLCDVVATLFEHYQHDDRITIPMFSFLERLLSSNCVTDIVSDPQSTFPTKILKCAKAEIAKNSNTKKLIPSIDFFCQLIQVPGEVCRRSLVQLGILLCHRFLWLRRTTATKLYEALTVYGDDIGIEPEALEQVMNILSETEWDSINTEVVRAKRNTICQLLKIPVPKSGPAKQV